MALKSSIVRSVAAGNIADKAHTTSEHVVKQKQHGNLAMCIPTGSSLLFNTTTSTPSVANKVVITPVIEEIKEDNVQPTPDVDPINKLSIMPGTMMNMVQNDGITFQPDSDDDEDGDIPLFAVQPELDPNIAAVLRQTQVSHDVDNTVFHDAVEDIFYDAVDYLCDVDKAVDTCVSDNTVDSPSYFFDMLESFCLCLILGFCVTTHCYWLFLDCYHDRITLNLFVLPMMLSLNKVDMFDWLQEWMVFVFWLCGASLAPFIRQWYKFLNGGPAVTHHGFAYPASMCIFSCCMVHDTWFYQFMSRFKNDFMVIINYLVSRLKFYFDNCLAVFTNRVPRLTRPWVKFLNKQPPSVTPKSTSCRLKRLNRLAMVAAIGRMTTIPSITCSSTIGLRAKFCAQRNYMGMVMPSSLKNLGDITALKDYCHH